MPSTICKHAHQTRHIDQFINMHVTGMILVVALAVSALAMKPSEAGVNDWHINNIGEVREVAFFKNRILFSSHLGSVGSLDKHSGSLEQRTTVAESERVAGWRGLAMTVATKYNQVITYTPKQTGVERQVIDHLMAVKQKIIAVARTASSDYYLTSTALYHQSEVLRQVKEGETFVSVNAGTNPEGEEVLYLIYQTDSWTGIEAYMGGQIIRQARASYQSIRRVETGAGLLVIETDTSSSVFDHHLAELYHSSQKLLEIVGTTVVFDRHSYHLSQSQRTLKRPISCNRPQFTIFVEQKQGKVAFLRDDITLVELPAGQSEVLRAWFNYKSELEYEFIIQYRDLQLAAYSFSRNELQSLWKREESLAYVQDVVFMKYFQLDTLDNEYHRSLLSHTHRALPLAQRLAQVPKDIILRLSQQFNDIYRHLLSLKDFVMQQITAFDYNSVRKFTMSAQQQMKYGLKKYIIAATGRNTVLALDTKTKALLWKVNRDSEGPQYVGLIQLQQDYETEVAVLVSFSPSRRSIILHRITEQGDLVLLKELPASAPPLFYKLNSHSLIFVIGEEVQRYSLLPDEDEAEEKQFYFYRSTQHQITGWKVVGSVVAKVWSFETGEREKILKVTSAFRGDQRSHIPLYDREKVFFKNVDFTNLAVVTSLNHTNMGVYAINGRTGKVQFNSYKNNVNMGLPFSIAYDENNILVAYFNARNKMYEIWTIEQYQERIESSPVAIITDYLQEQHYKPQENREQTIFEEQVFGLSLTVKEMFVSESKMSLTRRNLLVITRQNKIYNINRDMVSSRRPIKDGKGFFANQKLPEYQYMLPHMPVDYLSYHLPLANLSRIVFSPTDMESSIFALCTGTDLFLVRMAPDKTFDLIADDFNHVLLLVILVAGTVVISFFNQALIRAKLRKPHLE